MLVIVAIVCPIAVLVGLVLGSTIGRVLVPSHPLGLFPSIQEPNTNAPEPTEFARFFVAALIPICVIAGVMASAQRPPRRWLTASARPSWILVPALVLLVAALSWFGREYNDRQFQESFGYFSGREGLFALVSAVALTVALGGASVRRWLRSVLSLRSLAWVAPLLVVLLVVAFLLPAVQTNESFRASVGPFAGFHYVSTLADFEAVANGASPGVDYAPEYASVLAYLLTPLFELVDFQAGAVVDILVAISGLILLSFYRVLWLSTRSAAIAALLFVPVLGLTFFPAGEFLGLPINNTNTFQVLPIRYLGPAAVALMLAWHLARGHGSRSRVAIFLVATLAAISTPDFGTAAVIASSFAFLVLAVDEPDRLGEVKCLIRDALIGAAAAIALFASFSVLRSGELPSPSLLLYFPRFFASHGFGLIPMDTVGLHWLLYLTFAGGMVLAGVRSLSREPDRLLTGVLAFFASLGLAAGVYYVGRTNQFTLISLFPLWGMTLALIGWIVLRDMVRHPGPSFPVGVWVLRGLVLFSLGLGVASVTNLDTPWHEVDRIATESDDGDQLDVGPEAGFIGSRTTPGERTVILCRSAFRIADEAGVRNVSPIADPQNLIGDEQVRLVADQLDDEGGTKLFTCDAGLLGTPAELAGSLRDLGFTRSGKEARLLTGNEYATFYPNARLGIQQWLAPPGEAG